jgi:hypothetical protein
MGDFPSACSIQGRLESCPQGRPAGAGDDRAP